MALYRCAACGSDRVKVDKEAGGYSYAKGALGTAILGVGGAVAGINGKDKAVYKCPDCGVSLTYAMPENIKKEIEFGLLFPESRNQLTLNGMPVDWDVLLRRYPNIEDTRNVSSVPASGTIKTEEVDEIDSKGEYAELVKKTVAIMKAVTPGYYDKFSSFKWKQIVPEQYKSLLELQCDYEALTIFMLCESKHHDLDFDTIIRVFDESYRKAGFRVNTKKWDGKTMPEHMVNFMSGLATWFVGLIYYSKLPQEIDRSISYIKVGSFTLRHLTESRKKEFISGANVVFDFRGEDRYMRLILK